MTFVFDQHAINHMIVALGQEMIPQSGKRQRDADTVFIGAMQPPTDADRRDIAGFGLNKNYNIVFPFFDGDVHEGPIGFDVVVTDGLTQASMVPGGRLWKRDQRSPAILLFPELNMMVKLSGKGRLIVREMAGQYHDHGYDLALRAVRTRAARRPGKIPIISSIGHVPVVLDIDTMLGAFAAAA